MERVVLKTYTEKEKWRILRTWKTAWKERRTSIELEDMSNMIDRQEHLIRR
jgi:hypothetical protein